MLKELKDHLMNAVINMHSFCDVNVETDIEENIKINVESSPGSDFFKCFHEDPKCFLNSLLRFGYSTLALR